MNGTVCYRASKVTSYSPFPAEPFLCIYHWKRVLSMIIKAFNILLWRVRKIAVCSMAEFYVKPAEELVFCVLILICPVQSLEIPYFHFSGYAKRGQEKPLVKAAYRLYYRSNSRSFFFLEQKDPVVPVVTKTSLRSSGLKLSKNVYNIRVNFHSCPLCLSRLWERLPSLSWCLSWGCPPNRPQCKQFI